MYAHLEVVHFMAFGLGPLLKADAANKCANLAKVLGAYIYILV